MAHFHVCLTFFYEKKLLDCIAHEVIVIYDSAIPIYDIVR